MSTVVELESPSPARTRKLGSDLGRLAQAGDVILLTGDLGSGKTTLVQGISRGLGVREPARSPTFVLVSEHHGRLPLYHVDLYRIGGLEEALDAGIEECVDSEGVCVVEWADRAPAVFPAEHLSIHLEMTGPRTRRLKIRAKGARYETLAGQVH